MQGKSFSSRRWVSRFHLTRRLRRIGFTRHGSRSAETARRSISLWSGGLDFACNGAGIWRRGEFRSRIQRHHRSGEREPFPQSTPHQPSELNYQAWSAAPASASYLAFGNLSGGGSDLAAQAWFYDVRNPGGQAVIAKIYRGQPTDDQVRLYAHQFADEILKQLSGGLPGISTTQIAFVSARTGNKEIWVMDYDGQNQHA